MAVYLEMEWELSLRLALLSIGYLEYEHGFKPKDPGCAF
jgi:hypothetical protein